MKKLLLIFVLPIFFLGCSWFPTTTVSEDVSDQEEASTVSTISNDEETDLYTIHAEYPTFPSLSNVNYLIQKMINTETEFFIEEVDSMELTTEEIEEFGGGKSSLYITYTVYQNSENYISAAFYNSVYMSGAAHPYSYTTVLNYDLKENQEIKLVDLFVPDTDYAAALSYMIVPKLKEKLYEDELTDDEWIEEGASPDPQNFQQFNLTEEGIIFHFDPYVVAAYAAGPQEVEIGYNELFALLDPYLQNLVSIEE